MLNARFRRGSFARARARAGLLLNRPRRAAQNGVPSPSGGKIPVPGQRVALDKCPDTSGGSNASWLLHDAPSYNAEPVARVINGVRGRNRGSPASIGKRIPLRFIKVDHEVADPCPRARARQRQKLRGSRRRVLRLRYGSFLRGKEGFDRSSCERSS